jgi:hypothetical protein
MGENLITSKMNDMIYVIYEDKGPVGGVAQSCRYTNGRKELYIAKTEAEAIEFAKLMESLPGRKEPKITGMFTDEHTGDLCSVFSPAYNADLVGLKEFLARGKD